MREVVVRSDAAATGEPLADQTMRAMLLLRVVHALVRSSVPGMDIDREVAAQLASVNDLLPEICRVAAESFPGFQEPRPRCPGDAGLTESDPGPPWGSGPE